MISLRIEIVCDECGLQYGDSSYPSVAHAREAVEKAGWTMHVIYSKPFDFCQVCQRDGAQQVKGAAA